MSFILGLGLGIGASSGKAGFSSGDPLAAFVASHISFEGSTSTDDTGRSNTLVGGAIVTNTSALSGFCELDTSAANDAYLSIDDSDGVLTQGAEDFCWQIEVLLPASQLDHIALLDNRPNSTVGQYTNLYISGANGKVTFDCGSDTLTATSPIAFGGKRLITAGRKGLLNFIYVDNFLAGSVTVGVKKTLLSRGAVFSGAFSHTVTLGTQKVLSDEIRLTAFNESRYNGVDNFTVELPFPTV